MSPPVDYGTAVWLSQIALFAWFVCGRSKEPMLHAFKRRTRQLITIYYYNGAEGVSFPHTLFFEHKNASYHLSERLLLPEWFPGENSGFSLDFGVFQLETLQLG